MSLEVRQREAQMGTMKLRKCLTFILLARCLRLWTLKEGCYMGTPNTLMPFQVGVIPCPGV